MVVTLTCAFCKRQETGPSNHGGFEGWFTIRMVGGHNHWVCSDECGAAWFMRKAVEREQAYIAWFMRKAMEREQAYLSKQHPEDYRAKG